MKTHQEMKAYFQIHPGRVMIDIDDVINWISNVKYKENCTTIEFKRGAISELEYIKRRALEENNKND